jgi:hypothetical protein
LSHFYRIFEGGGEAPLSDETGGASGSGSKQQNDPEMEMIALQVANRHADSLLQDKQKLRLVVDHVLEAGLANFLLETIGAQIYFLFFLIYFYF